MDFASVCASGSGFASADTRFRRNTSPAATGLLKSAWAISLVLSGNRRVEHTGPKCHFHGFSRAEGSKGQTPNYGVCANPQRIRCGYSSGKWRGGILE
jgi:hypothetical protein